MLIVESDLKTSSDLEKSLTSMKYAVTSIVSTGLKAIKQIKKDNPDIVLINVRLKGKLNGVDTAEVIRDKYDLPVILLAGPRDERKLEQAKLTLPFGYIFLPILKRQLKVTIEMTLYIAKIESEREKSRQQLQEAWGLLDAAVAQSPYGVLIADAPNVNIRMANSAAVHFRGEGNTMLTGIDVDQHAKRWQTFNLDGSVFPPEQLPLSRAVLKGETVRNCEVVIRDDKGVDHVVSANSSPIRDEDGNVKAGLVIFNEITKEKKAEAALRESEEHYRNFFDNALVGLIRNRISDGLFLEVNAKAAALIGVPIDKIRGKMSANDLIKNQDQRIDFMSIVKRDGAVNNFEMDLSLPNGRDATFSVSFYSYPDDDYMEGAIVDITDQKKAEQALKDSEEKYRKVVDNAIEAICVVQDNHYKYFNPEFINLLGYTENELLKIHIDDIIYNEDKILVSRRRQNRIEGKLTQEAYTHRIVNKNGRIRWVDVKSVTISWESEPAALVFLTDITEKKRAEELVIQTEKMLSVGGLAAGMAHELNNPLGGILQGAQNILRRFSPDLKSNIRVAEELGIDLEVLQDYIKKREISAFLTGIRESGIKASEIISNMLKFSRKSEPNMIPADLIELIDRVLELASKDYSLKKQYDFRNIKIIKDYDKQLPKVPCTETEIEQVILNLLSNATWAMAQTPSGRSPQITLRLKREDEMARIEVEDNGPGMDEATRKRIFEPFYTTKPVGEGTGLGLSVSYMIVTNNHKGTIEVVSELNKGARFIIRIPLFLDSDSGE